MSRDNLALWADEYVLGLLDPLEAEAFEAALKDDAALKAALAASRDRFLQLDASTPPLALPEGLWRTIEAQLDAAPAPTPASAPRTEPMAANLTRAPRWRRYAAVAALVAVAGIGGLGLGRGLQPEPVVIAVLLDEDGAVRAMVEDFGDNAARVRLLETFAVPAGQVMEVWTLPSEDTGPVSLGLLEDATSRILRGPDLPAPGTSQLYEITLEPAGGSPTGRPTGPILAKGLAQTPV